MFGKNRSVDIQTAVRKALQPNELPPKRKHVRSCIVYTWETKSSRAFWECVKNQTIKNSISTAEPITDAPLYKTLILIHKVLQEGHPSCLVGGFKNIEWISTIDTLKIHEPRYGLLIGQYVSFLIRKLRFHHNHRGFNGTFEYEEYVSLSTVSDPNEGYDALLDLLSLQDALDEFSRYILNSIKGADSECIISALVPVIAESYGIYKFLISMIRAMNRTSDSEEILMPLQDHFKEQHTKLFNLYADCSRVKFLNTLITIPKLPYDAPSLLVSNEEEDVEKTLPKLKEQKTSATGWNDLDYNATPEPVKSQATYGESGSQSFGNVNTNESLREPINANFTQANNTGYSGKDIYGQMNSQKEVELEKQFQKLQLQQQEFQNQQYLKEQQTAVADQQMQEQYQLLIQQTQNQAQMRIAQLENDVVALKGQCDSDQLLLQSYDSKVQALENQLEEARQRVVIEDNAKNNELSNSMETAAQWKGKYESLAKLYSQLRQEHLTLLAKSKKVQQKASSAQEAIEKREKVERDMKAKNIELADLIKERDRAKLELEKYKNSSTHTIDVLIKSSTKRIEDALFDMNSSEKDLVTIIEKTSNLATTFATSFNSFLVSNSDGEEAEVIDSITRFTTSVIDILKNSDTGKDVAMISQMFLETLYSKNLETLDLETKTDKVINGNIDVQEVLQSLQNYI